LFLAAELPPDAMMGLGWGLAIGFLLLILILLCVLGNLLVILAILCERDLRSRPQYYLIFSLAVADLMVLFLFPSNSGTFQYLVLIYSFGHSSMRQLPILEGIYVNFKPKLLSTKWLNLQYKF
jgi:hypothetical protein